MPSRGRLYRGSYQCDLRVTSAVVAFLILFVPVQRARAQTYHVLHTFTNGADGGFPGAGLTIDQFGNLYGTTEQGGTQNAGTVFKLVLRNSSWVFSPLYSFTGGDDGFQPLARPIVGPNGSLYGTTTGGGIQDPQNCGCCGCGTVFSLRPRPNIPSSVLTPWDETVIHRFAGSPSDGSYPASEVVFDRSGNLYGTTTFGGLGVGTVYKLGPQGSGWMESLIYNFGLSLPSPNQPNAGVVFDNAGNLYGSCTMGGPDGEGSVFQLSSSGSNWTENTILAFGNGPFGATPYAGLVFDNAGNLYGATTSGNGSSGVAFELTPSNGSWIPRTVYDFSGDMNPYCGNGPYASLTVDPAGNLYGTNCGDSSVFKLAPSNGGWTYTSLHSFESDDRPLGGVVMDAHGNLYGTTAAGGDFHAGVVWEITP